MPIDFFLKLTSHKLPVSGAIGSPVGELPRPA